ncbi:pentatricopeptide repeat-containing protein At1g08070, chloroplastic-like [Abrus precatorius]|uniref:Pentatricopeptide repeat-containing protein At1g08070, chloroplastic-like n=1 Tax=Abrus precatorius TaxID=3816 RepID=A0A8B8LXN1_ABRPR|nr:pentatricopeptide repeat-containing protein At1g08070, chloroplastic-like [Abrus precatorius]
MAGLEQMKPQNLNQIAIRAQQQLITNPNPQLLNPLLALLTSSRNAFFHLYNQMLSHPSSHNHFTFTHALKACSSLHARSKALEIHAHLIKSGHYFDLFIQNSLLHFYLIHDDVVSASRLFRFISSPDVVSWTSMVSGLAKCGFEAEAIRAFSSMNVKPNAATLVSALSACSSLKALRFGKAIHGYGVKLIVDGNVVFDNAVLDLYAKCGSLKNAEKMFVKMSKKDVVSWTTLLMGYKRGGYCEEAFAVFKQMAVDAKAEPNEATVVTVLSACASIGTLSLGQWVHSYIDSRCDLVVDGNIGNALLNMYVKCGDMHMGIMVFDMIGNKDVISWGTIICGLAMNGHGKQALQLFSRMLVQGVPPDDVTFIGLLSACSHEGLVSEGIMFFKAMRDFYGIVPQMRHYGCMIDMYGRAGLFEEAEAILRGMPVEAEGPIWGALLQACKIHGNEKLSEWIGEHLDKKNVGVGTLALLSNLYASSERWDDANKVRKTIRGTGLKKVAGCSWVELETSTNRLDSNLCVA